MTPTLHIIHRILQHNSIPHEVVSDPTGGSHSEELTARFPGEAGEEITLKASEGCDGVFFSTHIRDLTAEEIPAAEAFAGELHRSVRTGLFTVSPSAGEFGFTVYRLPGDHPPTAEELAPLLFTGPMMAQLYGPALELVLEGVSPEAALEAVEKTDGKPVMSFMLPPDTAVQEVPVEDEDDEEFQDGYPQGIDADLDRGLLTDQVREYYDSQKWKYEYDPVGNSFRMQIASRCVDCYRVVTFIHDEEWFTTLTVFPIRVPEEKREEAAEFFARANYGMVLGCFEMDPKNGLVQFKDTCLCGEVELDMAVIERHVDIGFRMCDRYGPALLEMLYGGASAADAIRRAEKDLVQKNIGLVTMETTEEEARPEPQPEPQPGPQPEAEETPAKKGFVRRFLERLGILPDDAPGEGGRQDG